MLTRRAARALLLALALALPLLGHAGLAGPAGGQEGGVNSSVSVRVESVACARLPDGTTQVSILLALPNPGYKIVGKNATLRGGTAYIDIRVEPSSGPVIQVIQRAGVSVSVPGSPARVVVEINGSPVYTGGCGPASLGAEGGGTAGPAGGGASASTPSPSTAGAAGPVESPRGAAGAASGQGASTHSTGAAGGAGGAVKAVGAGLLGLGLALLAAALARR